MTCFKASSELVPRGLESSALVSLTCKSSMSASATVVPCTLVFSYVVAEGRLGFEKLTKANELTFHDSRLLSICKKLFSFRSQRRCMQESNR